VHSTFRDEFRVYTHIAKEACTTTDERSCSELTSTLFCCISFLNLHPMKVGIVNSSTQFVKKSIIV
jgi:hypothetical protein